MKTCPSCAEAIQDAAIVCKHCGREAATPPKPLAVPIRASMGRGKLAALILGPVALVFLISVAQSDDPTKTLDVTARTSATAIEITNAGSGDQAGQELVVYINGSPPSTYKAVSTLPRLGEHVRLPLSAFTLKDGTRFNPFATAVTVIWIGGGGYDYRSFQN